MDKLGNDILQRLDLLASKLGTTVDQLWGVLVKQCYVNGVTASFWFTISLVGLIICCKNIYSLNMWGFDQNVPTAKGYKSMTSIAFFVILFLIMSHQIADITQMINPEYFAYNEIVKLFN